MHARYIVTIGALLLAKPLLAQQEILLWEDILVNKDSAIINYTSKAITQTGTVICIQKAQPVSGKEVYRKRRCQVEITWERDHYTEKKYDCNTYDIYQVDEYKLADVYDNSTDGSYFIDNETYRRHTPLTPRLNNLVLDDISIDTVIDKKERVDIFLEERKSKNGLMVAVQFMPAFSDAIDNISHTTNDYTGELYRRADAERADWAWNANIQVGWRLSNTQSLFLEGNKNQMAFKTSELAVDWSNGLAVPNDVRNHHYRWMTYGLGIGYGYSGYRRCVNLEFQTVLSYNWLEEFKDVVDRETMYSGQYNNVSDLHMRNQYVTGKVSLGFNIRWGYEVSIRVMPTLIYNFSPVHDRLLYTKLYSAGLTVGFAYHFWESFKK